LTVLVISRYTVGIISVRTKLDRLFPVSLSVVDAEIVAILIIIPHVALTVHVMVIDHVCPIQSVRPESVNVFHDMSQLDAVNHVRPDGKISVICTHVACVFPEFP
jgi:hypothetical protein